MEEFNYLTALDEFAGTYNHKEKGEDTPSYHEQAEIPTSVMVRLSMQTMERLARGLPAKLKAKDGRQFVIMPYEKYETLSQVAVDYSMLQDSLGKNIHGIDQLPPEVRYGRKDT